jgi:hypothetical protein
MTDWTDQTLRPLDELVRLAFPEGSGITADTLKRRARQGKLRVYRPGKAFVSTLADVWEMIDATRVGPPGALSRTHEETESVLANLRLDRALKDAEQRAEEEWLRTYEARKAARKPPRLK